MEIAPGSKRRILGRLLERGERVFHPVEPEEDDAEPLACGAVLGVQFEPGARVLLGDLPIPSSLGHPGQPGERIPAGGELPLPDEYEERAAYVVSGTVECGEEQAERGRMLVFTPVFPWPCMPSAMRGWLSSAARRSTASGIFSGTSSRARRRESSRPSATGRKADSQSRRRRAGVHPASTVRTPPSGITSRIRSTVLSGGKTRIQIATTRASPHPRERPPAPFPTAPRSRRTRSRRARWRR